MIRQIIDVELEPGSLTERSRDLWVFSYLCNGMNMSDIARLRWNQVNESAGIITFVRRKTSRSRRANQVNIVAILLDETKAIIERWATSRQWLDRPLKEMLDILKNEFLETDEEVPGGG